MLKKEVSIHAPAWGATEWGGVLRLTLFISIHAPAWGAALGFNLPFIVIMFQSTHPHGVRPEKARKQAEDNVFQSTHPHGVRLTLNVSMVDPPCFNPRTRMGCGNLDGTIIFDNGVSIHTPAWGAAGDLKKPDISPGVSIHAPAWGAAK